MVFRVAAVVGGHPWSPLLVSTTEYSNIYYNSSVCISGNKPRVVARENVLNRLGAVTTGPNGERRLQSARALSPFDDVVWSPEIGTVGVHSKLRTSVHSVYVDNTNHPPTN